MAAYSWSTVNASFIGFLYPIFLTILLFHRSSRDDKKCSEKYKQHWVEYCKHVKYKIIPFIY